MNVCQPDHWFYIGQHRGHVFKSSNDSDFMKIRMYQPKCTRNLVCNSKVKSKKWKVKQRSRTALSGASIDQLEQKEIYKLTKRKPYFYRYDNATQFEQ